MASPSLPIALSFVIDYTLMLLSSKEVSRFSQECENEVLKNEIQTPDFYGCYLLLAAGSCSHNTGTSISHSLQTENVQSSTRSLTVLAAPTDIWRDLAESVESDLKSSLSLMTVSLPYQWKIW
jgi:hypothetical protein